MESYASAKLVKIDARSDGGANVWFKVRLGDYLLEVPLTVEDTCELDMAEVGKLARKQFAGLAAALAKETARWAE